MGFQSDLNYDNFSILGEGQASYSSKVRNMQNQLI